MDKITKSLGQAQLSTDADAKGHVRAVVCTYGVVDKDGDVVRKGAIPDGTPVILSQYNHNSITGSALPVGSGVIKSYGDEAVLEGEFFMDTAHGRDAFHTVKALAEKGLGEWSWGFIATNEERGEFEGKSVNFINMTKTFEASFVAVGAGVNTRTLEAKGLDAPEAWVYNKSLDKWVSSKGREATRTGMALVDSDGPELTKLAPGGVIVNPDEDWSYKRSFSAEERKRLASEGKALPDGSFPIVNEEDLKNAIQAIGRASDSAAAKRHIRKRARALGKEDLIPDSWGDGKKFADEGNDVLKSLQAYRSRAADVLAMRQEKGKALGEEALAIITDLVTEAKALEAMLAEAPPATTDDPPPAEEKVIATFDDDETLLSSLAAFLSDDNDINEGETE